MIKLYLKTRSVAPYKSEYIEVCTCRDDENVIRKIVEGYDNIWEELYNRPIGWLKKPEDYGSSTDPIILNWGNSEILIEDTETKESEYFNL